MDALKIANMYAEQQRQNLIKKAALAEQQNDRRTAYTAHYQGYDADSGLHRVALEDGSQAWGEFNSNGGVAIGQTVAFNRPHGSSFGFLKAMPR